MCGGQKDRGRYALNAYLPRISMRLIQIICLRIGAFSAFIGYADAEIPIRFL